MKRKYEKPTTEVFMPDCESNLLSGTVQPPKVEYTEDEADQGGEIL